jgi:hypothetical protein
VESQWHPGRDPQRLLGMTGCRQAGHSLARLSVAGCLAYLWSVFLGAMAKRDGWVAVIRRIDDCDLSLFQLGLGLLEHLLDEHLPIPVAFQTPVRSKTGR